MKNFILLFLIVFLAGCERTLPGTNMKQTNGYVESKLYRPPYTTEEDNSTTIDCGDFSITIPGSITVYHPETFWVTVFYRNEKDEPKKVQWEITKSFYESISYQDNVRISVEKPFIERLE